jgi:hypothetical protein
MFSFLLKFIGGGLLGELRGMLADRQNSDVEKDRIAAEFAIRQIDSETAARQNAREIRLATAGHWEMRLITALIAGTATLHYVLVGLDTCFRLGWRIPAFPAPFDEWEGAILLSFFGVQAASKSVSSIAAAVAIRRRGP